MTTPAGTPPAGTPPAGTPPAGTPPAGTPPATPWYTGKVDNETVGYWQIKGLDVNDPAAIAVATSKFHREAEKFLGAPSNQLLRMPAANDEAAQKTFWQRLGAPVDAAGYDFTTVKRADGKDLDPKFVDHVRGMATALNLPKDTATRVATEFLKFTEGADTEAAAVKTAALATEKTALATNWGANAEANMFVAKSAAKALGIGPETVTALESVIGYSKVMDMFRVIGTKIGEDKFITNPGGNNNQVMTRDQAAARLTELKADQAFVKRYLSGDAAAAREMGALQVIIANGITDGKGARAA